MNPVHWLEDLERCLILVSIRKWRKRYAIERALAALPRNAGELGYRMPDLGGESG